MASVVGLFVASAIGQPMQTCTSVRAFAGRGLEGDRYERGEGSYSKLPRVAARHVSLIACEAIEAANRELVQRGLIPFEANETRRNIVVDGIDVYGLLGKEFRIGAVRLRGSEPTRPCHLPSAVTGKMGFAEAYRDRGGVRAEVLSDGIISIGDPIKRINGAGLLLAQSVSLRGARPCPELGAKPTWQLNARTSQFDPSATWAVHCGNALDIGFSPYQSTRLSR